MACPPSPSGVGEPAAPTSVPVPPADDADEPALATLPPEPAADTSCSFGAAFEQPSQRKKLGTRNPAAAGNREGN